MAGAFLSRALAQMAIICNRVCNKLLPRLSKCCKLFILNYEGQWSGHEEISITYLQLLSRNCHGSRFGSVRALVWKHCSLHCKALALLVRK